VREFFQSCTTLAFSMSLLGVELMDNMTSMKRREFKGSATHAIDAVSNAAVEQLGPRLRSAFRGINDVQRAVVGIVFDLSSDLARTSLNWLADDNPVEPHQKSASQSSDRNSGQNRLGRHQNET
jgi:hypothetical protein